MITNPETLNSELENSELLQTKEELSSLKKEVKEGVEPSITKGPYEKDGAIIFDYEKSGQKWEIVTRKDGDTYKIRVKKWTKLPNGKMGWQTQKNGNSETFNFTASDKTSFNKGLGNALNKTIGANRDKLPKTGGKVYDMLNIGGNNKKDNQKESKESKESKETTEKTNLKEKPIDLKYKEINKEKELEPKPNYPKNEKSVEGRITRCLRFKSITDTVEDRYGIPRGLLMAMMAQEGWGDPTVINQRGPENSKRSCDGGAGLIHIQAVNAKNYGMHTLQRFTDTMADYQHGEKLEDAKKNTGNNLAKLSELDDRFNPVLAVDLAARFLMSDCKGKNCDKNNLDSRLTVAGRYNNPKKTAEGKNRNYMYSVLVYWTTINKVNGDSMPKNASKEVKKVMEGKGSASVNGTQENVTKCVTRTKNAIANINPSLDGKRVSLDEYYEYLEGQWDNYGLQAYIKNNKEHPYVK